MNPRQRFFILFLILWAPAMTVMMFLILRYPPNNVPVWIPVGWGFYMLATIVLVALFGRRIVKAPLSPAAQPDQQNTTSAMGGAVMLIVVWTGFFLYGTFKFVRGEIPVERAIPAGSLLVAFILVFTWLLLRDAKSRRMIDNPPRS
jgi:hypothetical protein